jgi:creatinine amidohydrolase/Fe(II)-dependent formamide hydrolase-like protein
MMKRTTLLLGVLFVASTLPVMTQQQGQASGQGTVQGQGQGQARGQGQAGRGGRRGGGQADPRSIGGGNCSNNPYNCIDTPNPLTPPDTVWLEDMTWMDVRDAMAAGKKTIIISTGGIEPNGPWIALGKHNFVLTANCDAIARSLGNALCAPIVKFVPEGNLDPPSSHMRTMGTISLEETTYQALLSDIVRSFKAHGFENIMMIGDSGGNGRGMQAVADKFNTEWSGAPVVAHIREHYDYGTVSRLLDELGVTTEAMTSDGLHDDPGITMNIMVADPEAVRWSARVKAGKATINGVSIADKDKALEIGRKIVEMRTANTVAAIKAKIASKGK